MMASHKHRKKENIPWRVPIKGMLIAVGVSVALILLLTLLVYLGWLPETAIPIGNTVIKALASAAAGFFVGRSRMRIKWWYGAIAAAAAQVVLWVLMNLYLGTWTLSWNLLADLLLSIAVGGAVSAILNRKQT